MLIARYVRERDRKRRDLIWHGRRHIRPSALDLGAQEITEEAVAFQEVLQGARPTSGNGLRKPSQVMVDKAATVRREQVGAPFGRLESETMLAVTRSLALVLGFG